MKKIHFKFVKSVLAASLFAFSSYTMGAIIPEGTVLAEEQVFRFNNSSDPTTIDPQKAEESSANVVVKQLFETLVISDRKGNLLPGAAVKWEHSEDYKTWTFYLRPEAKWSNGDPVTAEDFVFAFQRLADPKTAATYASYLEYLKLDNANDVIAGKKTLSELGVKALDEHTLQLTLSESVPYADKLTEHYVLAPVNKKVVEQYGDKWTDVKNIVGNGAFKITNWVVNEKIELVPNPYYWDNANTVLTKIVLYSIVSENASYTRYRANEVDVSSFPSELRHKVKKELPNEVHVAPALGTYYYEFNNAVAPMNNKDVRQALSLALDRRIITDKVLGNGQIPAYFFTPSYISGAEKMQAPEWANWTQAQRNQKAIELLKQAGYSKQNPLRFDLLYNTSEGHKAIAIAVASMWKKNTKNLVDVTLSNQEWKTFLDTKNSGNYTVARAGWIADYNEATTFLNIFLSDSTNNASNWKNASFDDAISQSFLAKTEEERQEAYAKAEKILSDDFATLPIYWYASVRLIKPYVKGYAFGHPSGGLYFKDVYLTK
ncbi:oligopeptide ABC transporter substrate-binding protein OppA [[Haemophilus] felis]|nr:oligopeptide ABC transporter substrate-binding protein OppA [[Haemophilus] felis]NBI43770.1 oligopeptide ABC transporter substrate-binding protein OppA [[Haemophilus] felis]